MSYRLGLGSVWECLVLAGLPYCIGLQNFYLVVWIVLELCLCSLCILYLDCLLTQPFLPSPLLCMECVKAALTSPLFSICRECVKVDSISLSVLYLESVNAALISLIFSAFFIPRVCFNRTIVSFFLFKICISLWTQPLFSPLPVAVVLVNAILPYPFQNIYEAFTVAKKNPINISLHQKKRNWLKIYTCVNLGRIKEQTKNQIILDLFSPSLVQHCTWNWPNLTCPTPQTHFTSPPRPNWILLTRNKMNLRSDVHFLVCDS